MDARIFIKIMIIYLIAFGLKVNLKFAYVTLTIYTFLPCFQMSYVQNNTYLISQFCFNK